MSYDFSKVRVMVAESTSEMYDLFKSVLMMLGIPDRNIDSAFTSEQAFEKFQTNNYDLIITDWLENPGKGIMLTKQIRRDAKSPNQYVPIIMTAGSSAVERVIRARDAGISEYLVKPFAANSLATRITRVIENPRNFVMSDSYAGPDRRVRSVSINFQERRKTGVIHVDEIDLV